MGLATLAGDGGGAATGGGVDAPLLGFKEGDRGVDAGVFGGG